MAGEHESHVDDMADAANVTVNHTASESTVPNASSSAAPQSEAHREIKRINPSKHPDATIGVSEQSLADLERGKTPTWHWVVFLVATLVALIAPYWLARYAAVLHTNDVIRGLNIFTTYGLMFISWLTMVTAIAGLAVMIVDSKKRGLWGTIFLIGTAFEQFLGGVALLKFDFWTSTYLVYGSYSNLANAINLGILSAVFGLATFAVLWVGTLVLTKKTSPLNVFTQSWAAFILFFVIEVIALLIVMFGGFIPMS